VTRLHTTSYGESGSRVVFLHGLFGQGRNWTTPARAIAGRHRVTLVDLPDHGRSEWTERLDYVEMADTVAELLESLGGASDPVDLVGHSMGGKTAMLAALRHPSLVARLMVVDIAPVAYASASEFARYVSALQGLDLARLRDRDEADAQLATAVPSETVRSFLLQNLRRAKLPDGSDGWAWQPNLAVIGRDLGALSGWPAEAAGAVPPYAGPTLWVAGERSDYIRPEYDGAMRALFPHYRKVTVKGAGHWVHSEQPETFLQILRTFLGDAA